MVSGNTAVKDFNRRPIICGIVEFFTMIPGWKRRQIRIAGCIQVERVKGAYWSYNVVHTDGEVDDERRHDYQRNN